MPNRTQDLAWSDSASAPEALEGRQRALPSGTAKEREKIYIYIYLVILLLWPQETRCLTKPAISNRWLENGSATFGSSFTKSLRNMRQVAILRIFTHFLTISHGFLDYHSAFREI